MMQLCKLHVSQILKMSMYSRHGWFVCMDKRMLFLYCMHAEVDF